MPYSIHVKIEGVAPILFNRWTEEASDKLRSGATGGKFTDASRLAEAMTKVYRDEEGKYLTIPGWNLKKCILQGCQRAGLKEGRVGMMPFLAATVFVAGDPVFVAGDPSSGVTDPDFVDERSGRRPAKTGGAALIKRPALKEGWQLPFTLNVVDDRRDAPSIRRAVEEAGLMVGLGDFRPEFGRFVVREWSVSR